MILSPIALFVYNRPDKTEKILNNLSKNIEINKSILNIICDHPKDSNQDDNLKNKEVLKIINKFNKCKELNIIKRKKNYGLYNNIVKGLNFFFKKNNSLIVLEDDLILDKFFLNFMNNSLNKLKIYKSVGSICGYIPTNISKSKKKKNNFFSSFVDCWGWATWKDRWKYYNKNNQFLFSNIYKKKDEFNLSKNEYFSSLLKNNHIRKNPSWAINWYASLFLKNKLNFYPSRSLVSLQSANGTNGYNDDIFKNKLLNKKIYIKDNFTEKEITNDRKNNKLIGSFYSRALLPKKKNFFQAFFNTISHN